MSIRHFWSRLFPCPTVNDRRQAIALASEHALLDAELALARAEHHVALLRRQIDYLSHPNEADQWLKGSEPMRWPAVIVQHPAQSGG